MKSSESNSGNCCELQVPKSKTSSPLPIFPKGGGTSVHRLIKIDRIYSRTPYALTDYDRHYRLDDRTVFSDRSPRPDTVQEAANSCLAPYVYMDI